MWLVVRRAITKASGNTHYDSSHWTHRHCVIINKKLFLYAPSISIASIAGTITICVGLFRIDNQGAIIRAILDHRQIVI
jgi:hypothetical protein